MNIKRKNLALTIAAGLFLSSPSISQSTPIIATYNTPGSTIFTAPMGVFNIQVEAWGGGGAGGAGRKDNNTGGNTSQNGGGGGGGAYARTNAFSMEFLQPYNITIPAAAVSGTNGTTTNGGGRVNGGDVSFVGANGQTRAAGGQGGANAYINNQNATTGQGGGAGGLAANSVGDVKFDGGAGSAGNTGGTNVSGSGGGGAGTANPGGTAITTTSTTTPGLGGSIGGGDGGAGRTGGNTNAGPGANGSNLGGGGGGGKNQGQNTRLGGTGGLGQLVLTYTLPLTWSTGNGTWDTIAPNNWVDVSTSSFTPYVDNLTPVLFEDAVGVVGNPIVTLDSTFMPWGVTVNSTLHNYSIVGTGGISGTNQLMLTQFNSSTLTLATANTYTGATSIRGGTMNLTGSLNGTAITVSGVGLLSQTSTGVISGAASLTHTASGTSTLAGANTYTGATSVSGGTLNLTGSLDGTAITVSGIGVFSQASTGVLSGTTSVSHSGSGTSILAGANTHSGATTVNTGTLVISGSGTGTSATNVNGGTLQLDYTTNNTSKIGDSAVLTFGGGTLDLKAGSHTEVVASTTLTAGTTSQVTRSSGAAILQMGAITNGALALIDFGASGIARTDTLNTNGILGPWATITGTDFAVNSTNVVNGLITAPTYTDVTRLNVGTQVIADGSTTHVRIVEGTGTAANITLGAATTTFSTLTQSTIGGSSAATINPAGQTLATNAILVGTGAGALTIGNGVNNGTLTTATVGSELALVANSVNSLTINSVIADNTSASSLSKFGPGPLILTGSNTYTGATTVNAGTLQLGAGGTIGSLDINSGIVLNSSSNLTIHRSNAVVQGTDFSGAAITGTGSFTQAGSGTTTLNAINTYSGPTTIAAGILNANSSTALGDESSTNTLIFNGGTLQASAAITSPATRAVNLTSTGVIDTNGNTVSIAGVASGAGGLTMNGLGTLTLTGVNTYAGATTISAGTLEVGAAGSLGSGTYAGVITNNGTLQYSSSAAQTLSGVISGTGAISKDTSTSSTLTLSGANLYSGPTTVNTGTLIVSNATALGTTAGGTTVADGARVELDGVTVTGEAITIAGAGGDNLGALRSRSGASVWTGPITIAADLTRIGAITGSTFEVSGVIDDGVNDYRIRFRPNSVGTTVIVSGANTYTGGTSIFGGTVVASSLNKVVGGTASSSFGAPVTEANGMIIIGIAGTVNDGILRYVGSGETTDRTIQIGDNSATPATGDTGSGAIENNGATGALVFSSPIFNSPTNNTINTAIAPRTFTIGGSNTAANTIAGVIQNNQVAGSPTATVGITKNGAGTWVLDGVNTYTGSTTVSAGTLSLTGARTVTAGAIVVGNLLSTTATLNISNGTFTTGQFSVGQGDNPLTAGIVNQTGGTLTMSGNQLLLGNGGTGTTAGSNSTGTYNLSGGTLNTIAGTLGIIIGTNTGATGVFNLSGTGNLNMAATSTLQISRSDANTGTNTTGAFNQTGGTATVGILRMGGSVAAPGAGGNATLNLTGGTFTAVTFGSLSVGNNSTSTINIGGTADVTLPAFPTVRGTGAIATINFDGGTLRNTVASTTYMGGLTNAFIKSGGAKFNTTNGNITITQNLLTDVMSLGGGFTKDGSNTLVLTGTNTYTGTTTVSAGTLQVGNGGATGTVGTGNVINNADFTINRTGTVTVGNISGAGATTVSGAGTSVTPTLIANDIDQASLTISNGAYVRLAPGSSSTSVLTALTVGSGLTPTANLDISDNDVVVNNPTPVAAASSLTAVAARVNSGFAGGAGIVTTTTGLGLETVGFGLNSFLSYPTFNGVAVNDDSVLIKYTYFGDSNLDGFVTDDDLGYFLAGYGSDISANPWILGDYNHDGFTTDDDLGFFLAAYGSTPGLSGGSIQAIPEPSTLVLGTLAGLGLGALSLRRRRAK